MTPSLPENFRESATASVDEKQGARCAQTRFLRFRRGEDGGATVEAVLWLPFFLFFFVLICDVAMIYYGKSQLTRITHDANRLLSIGYFDETEWQQYITERMAPMSTNVSFPQPISPATERRFTSSVRVPASDLDAVGFWGIVSDIDIDVQLTHVREYVS